MLWFELSIFPECTFTLPQANGKVSSQNRIKLTVVKRSTSFLKTPIGMVEGVERSPLKKITPRSQYKSASASSSARAAYRDIAEA